MSDLQKNAHPPTPAFRNAWWLDLFSEAELWREGQPDSLVEDVLERITDDAVCDVLRELEANGCKADLLKLLNLLRHWARMELSESTIYPPGDDRPKRNRAAARKLQRLLVELDALLGGAAAGIAYPLSQHLAHPLRVHRTYALLRALSEINSELAPAVESLAQTRLRPGKRPDERLQISIEALVEIYEFVTGEKATRRYDPVAESEESPFHSFAERVLRLLDGDADRPIAWAIRTVLEARKERAAASTSTRRQAGLGDDLPRCTPMEEEP